MRNRIYKVYKSRKSDEKKQIIISEIFNDMEKIARNTLINIDTIYEEKKIILEDYDNMTTYRKTLRKLMELFFK
jgi:hypothetical protein